MSRFGKRSAVTTAMAAAVSVLLIPAVAPSASPAPAAPAGAAAATAAAARPAPSEKAVFFASDGLRQDLVEKYAAPEDYDHLVEMVRRGAEQRWFYFDGIYVQGVLGYRLGPRAIP